MKKIYSNERINAAGKNLINHDIFSTKVIDDINIINEWRESFTIPLTILQNLVTKRANQISKKNIVVARLKKISSIRNKLIFNPKMSLSRFQDIGGCRVIFQNIKQVYHFFTRIERFHTNFIYYKDKTKNYLDEPKQDGYRGIHLIFKHLGKKGDYEHTLEVQCRTLLQHYWSTAVEVVSFFTNIALKSDMNKSEWRDFFVITSKLFKAYESKNNNKVENKNLVDEFLRINKRMKFTDKIQGYQQTQEYYVNHNDDFYNDTFVLLTLDLQNKKITIQRFKENEIEQAQAKYLSIESEGNPEINCVLVSVASLEDLKTGYSNYFTDTTMFIKELKKIIEEFKSN